MLVGQDPLAIERHLAAGLDQRYGAENALWDLAGKAAGLLQAWQRAQQLEAREEIQ
ncbi:MAG: hypothetical protein FJY95_09140 [Candidatus Handelsmanbacteria bacterium]|nr:hypothetical protein [Candidatus Handelsmanbacteria bacterium]